MDLAGEQMAYVAFSLGFFAMLGWLYLTTADRTAMRLLRGSILYFLLAPLLLAIAAAEATIAVFELFPSLGRHLETASLAHYLAGLLAAVIGEEALKLWASRSDRSGIRVFALVSLFGIYELMLFKPLMAFGPGDEQAILVQVGALPGLFLHVLTAAIYAFHWRSKPAVQFGVCIGLHLAFNILADQIPIGDALWLVSIVPLIGLTLLLLPKKGAKARGHWVLPKQNRVVPVP